MRFLSVLLGGQKTGRLIALDSGKIGFQYDPAWIETGFSLSPMYLDLHPDIQYPDTNDARIFKGLFGVFADSLPDGWGRRLMDRFFADQGMTNVMVLDRLAYIGSKGMGALEYQPETAPAKSEPVDLLQLSDASEKLLNGETVEVMKQLQQLYQDGSSPGGARPKVAVAFSEDMKECYSGVCDALAGFTHWLVKFRSKDDDVYKGAAEKAIADIADIAGIDMSPTRLLTVGNERFFATKRFDRDGNRKIHMHTMAGFVHADFGNTSFDYDNAMSAVGFLTKNMTDLTRMYKIAIFNVLTGNLDDHAKNFSFLHDKEWRLAPAYDLTHSSSFNNQHATTMMDRGMLSVVS